MSPGERLQAARHSLDFSVEQMADALGLRGDNGGDDVRKWERGAREPSGVVVRCAEALALIADLADHIDGALGATDRPGSDSAVIHARALEFLGVDE